MGVKQKGITLKRKKSDLSDSFVQLQVLNDAERQSDRFVPFRENIARHGHQQLRPLPVATLQINIGKLCNQTCAHCHVDAGPDRKEENMTHDTLTQCLQVIKDGNIKTVDITGGAPEMHPHFRWFVGECSALGAQVINRCNLTILMAHEKYADLPEFFAEHRVQIVSSLPYFSKTRTDSQRGDGVFQDSIAALKRLNAVGYGQAGSGLQLDLVYNPSGAFLPGDQASLEAEFKRQLDRRYGITFNSLFAITNLPISRFLDYLLESGNYQGYMEELVNAFNPATLDAVMCRTTLSVSWDGYLYDCDFNQMLDLKIAHEQTHIADLDIHAIQDRNIRLDQHCYGCTAGAGSSCGGEVV